MSNIARNIAALAITAVAVSHACPAAAASFDCSKAASLREKKICGDEKLSALDTKLGQIYDQRRALLSSQGADLLRQSQLSWLHFVGLACTKAKNSQYEPDGPAVCLRTKYEERLTDLAKVGQDIGPFRFNRIDIYGIRPAAADDQSGTAPGFFTQHVVYPQIDNALSPATRAWNRGKVRSLPAVDDKYDCKGDTDLDFEIGYANERFISLRWSDWTWCHGAPHGFGDYRVQNEMLTPSLPSVMAADIFGPGDKWIKPLQAMFWAALTAKGWAPSKNASYDVAADIDAHVVKPDQWFFTEKGLQTAFDSYEGGCYVCNPGRPTVPWASLRPILPANTLVTEAH